MDTAISLKGYVDKRRHLWLSQPFLPLLPSLSCYAAFLYDAPIFYWLTVIFWFGLIAFLDQAAPKDSNNPPENLQHSIEDDPYYMRVIVCGAPVYLVNYGYVAWFIANHEMSLASYVGISISMGIVSGLALAVGHEFGHKTSRFCRRMGKYFLAVGGVGQFLIGHLKGHHVHVSTPKDFASSQMGESLYHFGFMREQPGFFNRSWTHEKERLARKKLSAWSLQNETLQQYLGTTFIFSVLTLTFGWIVLPMLLLQMYVCWWYLTLIEYCQHYGLLRQEKVNGDYSWNDSSGRPTAHISWNTNMIASNNLLLNFVRHSGHHMRSTRWYQALRDTDLDGTPTLPYCYPLMFIAAMFPPLFYSIMDKRVLHLAGGDLEKINVFPPAKDRLIKQYGNL